MSIVINQNLCIGCKACKEVCPGNLIHMNTDKKAYMKYPKDCWGCTSCIKECQAGAIKFFLGADIGGRGSLMYTKQEKDMIHWIIEESGGTVKTIAIDRKSANNY